MTQLLYKFLLIISHKTKLTTKTKTTLYLQIKTVPLFYLHPILILHNPLKHKYHLVEIMIHLLFHLISQLRFTLIILLNKALQIHNILHRTLIQYIFKHQPHHHLLNYKLQPILQLKLTQYKLHNLP